MTQAPSQEAAGQKRSSLQEALDVHRIMSLVPLRPYMELAEVSSGHGFMAIPLAKFVWDGKVIAVDPDTAALERRVAEARLGNLTVLHGEGQAVPLGPGSVDGVVLTLSLHQAKERDAMLKQAGAALRKSGWCAVIEWRADAPQGDGPQTGERIAESEVERLGTEAGLRPTLRRELSDQTYLVLLTK
ncbi:MAG: class I SAM-dependent methyltransferase [Chloroflexi bacterium]|nr:class I SAM-dependent methyltransferase [Chloroflexota bacterium]